MNYKNNCKMAISPNKSVIYVRNKTCTRLFGNVFLCFNDFQLFKLKQKDMKRNVILSIFLGLLVMPAIFAQPGLVAYWSFDENTGDTLFDESGMGNHGTNYGAQRIPGIKGNVLLFDGFNDYARIPENAAPPPAHLAELCTGSISIWFKANHIPIDFGIAPLFYYGAAGMCDFFDAANQGMIIELGHTPIHFGSERLYFTIWKKGCRLPSFCFDSRNAITTGEWHHFVAVVGEDYNTGYLDGVEMTNRRYNFGNSLSSQFFEDAVVHEKLWLGKGYWDRTEQYFDGALDELRIYDRPLSSAEVMQLFSDTATTSIATPAQDNDQIRVFPNPAADVIYYDFPNNEPGILSYEISGLKGELVHVGRDDPETRKIHIGRLPAGVYLIRFFTAGNSYSGKFSVVRY
jgi:hypothetical protein